ncbi:alpha/beta hydrolase [Alkalilimnicola sp. S0819]|uniref:alpha/beta hydrolase n=1 Tax=Alkalilimnicola sp. S0819 TaxID=2613922 RepID=UPI001261B8C0|nr:alpha/beta fold hydrolase [Alkalilimnicola sp. S0819]KAB7623898.1 alpha/beta fold hydrolase [Alkalilimnicola sp. S0819]MPQ16493.1 alpha/beta fold hydrolase [Alkalilimnicola sp. S0819]
MNGARRWARRLLRGALGSLLLYLLVALALVGLGRPAEQPSSGAGTAFNAVERKPLAGLPAPHYYTAADGQRLAYRYYPARHEHAPALILIHGARAYGGYLHPLALRLSDAAHVYAPDLRGHGPQPKRRGDVDYVGQLEADLNALLALVRRQHPGQAVILGGHSAGGGLVIRHAGGRGNAPVDGHLLLAPYIHYQAPTQGEKVSAWASPNIPRMIGLTMLSRLGLTALNHLPVLHFHMPRELRDGTETLDYSYRLQRSLQPRMDYVEDLAALERPLRVLVGEDDESFRARAYPALFARHAPQAEVSLLPGLGHLDLIAAETSATEISRWLTSCCETRVAR